MVCWVDLRNAGVIVNDGTVSYRRNGGGWTRKTFREEEEVVKIGIITWDLNRPKCIVNEGTAMAYLPNR